MEKFNFRRVGISFGIVIILAGLALAKYYYFDCYFMSLNGRVNATRFTIKQTMYITVSNQEYNIDHDWPLLQQNVEIGDSLYKRPKQYDIELIKRKTGKKIICHY